MVAVIFLICFCLPLVVMGEPSSEELARRHQEFTDLYFKQNEETFVRLAQEGQVPKTLYIGCSDSRVIPELITSSKPGDLFVIRTAGNFVPPFSEEQENTGVIGTIEYAVNVLGVHDIIVCGHSHCGAIAGLFQDLSGKDLEALRLWLGNGEKAKKMTEGVPQAERLQQTEKSSVIYQLKNLLTYPFIKNKIEKDEMNLHGWYFDIESGQILYYDREKFQFVSLTGK